VAVDRARRAKSRDRRRDRHSPFASGPIGSALGEGALTRVVVVVVDLDVVRAYFFFVRRSRRGAVTSRARGAVRSSTGRARAMRRPRGLFAGRRRVGVVPSFAVRSRSTSRDAVRVDGWWIRACVATGDMGGDGAARRGAARADRAMAMAFGVGQKSAIDRVDEWRMGVAREACEDAGL